MDLTLSGLEIEIRGTEQEALHGMDLVMRALGKEYGSERVVFETGGGVTRERREINYFKDLRLIGLRGRFKIDGSDTVLGEVFHSDGYRIQVYDGKGPQIYRRIQRRILYERVQNLLAKYMRKMRQMLLSKFM